MKQQYQTRYEWLHESYQKWLTGFTRHAVSWGVCHPNIYYFHNLTPGWVSFNGEKPEIAIVPQSLHRLIYGPDKRATPPLDDDLIVNLCTSERKKKKASSQHRLADPEIPERIVDTKYGGRYP
ncbi:hypothetical protein L082_26243 [Escherichia coli SHECO001]|nr:hypothetical protein L082_26243 [Escherichia coli SHECO001]